MYKGSLSREFLKKKPKKHALLFIYCISVLIDTKYMMMVRIPRWLLRPKKYALSGCC